MLATIFLRLLNQDFVAAVLLLFLTLQEAIEWCSLQSSGAMHEGCACILLVWILVVCGIFFLSLQYLTIEQTANQPFPPPQMDLKMASSDLLNKVGTWMHSNICVQKLLK